MRGRCAIGLASAALLAGCGGGSSAAPAVGAFLGDWQHGRLDAAAALTTSPVAAGRALRSLTNDLQVQDATLRAGSTHTSGDHASASFAAALRLAGLGTWSYPGRLALVKRSGRWLVSWSPAALNPRLVGGNHLVRRRSLPARASILDDHGSPLLKPRAVVTVGLVTGALKNVRAAAKALGRTTGVDPRSVPHLIKGAGPQEFVPVITLRRAAYERVRARLHPVPGIHFLAGTLDLPPTRTFARAVIGQVGPATAQALSQAGAEAQAGDDVGLSGLEQLFQRRLAGTPTGGVHLSDPTGRTLATLYMVRGHPGSAVHVTLDEAAQRAAEAALRSVSKPAALVAVRASTGELVAVANAPADSTFDRALDASYPPGSTFKVITTAALLERGLDPSTTVRCPPSIVVDGRSFTNFEGETAGAVPFSTDFARSCNAAFVSLSRRLAPADIPRAAMAFGFGAHWSLPLAAYSGQAPRPADAVEQAADMIGQGRILASPLTMALVAGAVDAGRLAAPTLVRPGAALGAPPTARARVPPAAIRVTTDLRRLMRAVVTSGTGTAANLPGAPVSGKTGTAEFGGGAHPPTHAWFIGFRGDLAFAVLVDGGGVGGQVAAPIAAAFLRAAPRL